MTEGLVAMVSYQAADLESSIRLRDELALRGMLVVHDRTTFSSGTHVASHMDHGISTCDAFIAYITPDYLYEGRPSGSPRPALDNEFIPVVQRRRDAQAAATLPGAANLVRPLIYPVVRHLGDPRAEALTRIRAATGIDVSGWWTPSVDQIEADLPIADAATVAGNVLRAVLPAGGSAELGSGHDVSLVTRGTGQPPAAFTVDATALLGGSSRRVGAPGDWLRLLVGLNDLQGTLAENGPTRLLRVRAAAHLSAGILFGRVFHQAAGWHLLVSGRHGVSDSRDTYDADDGLSIVWDSGAMTSDWLSVEIDLLGQPVFELATERIRISPSGPRGRLQIRRADGTGDLRPEEISRMALAAARHVRMRIATERPARVALMCAGPSDFAVLLGHRLTGLWCDLELLERGESGAYEVVLTVPSSV